VVSGDLMEHRVGGLRRPKDAPGLQLPIGAGFRFLQLGPIGGNNWPWWGARDSRLIPRESTRGQEGNNRPR
jgi:hypothetical protein